MRFNSAASILTEIGQMQLANQPVQENRARINRLFNGDPPWTEAERNANRIFTNVNWLEPTRIAQNSRYQLNNAFFKPGNFFQIKLDTGTPHKRDEWGRKITKCINRSLKRSRSFRSAFESALAQVVLHGPGPTIWKNAKCPIMSSVGVDDILVPAGTLADMENLDYLCIYQEWTWAQLRDMTTGPAVDPGWNLKYCEFLIENMYKQGLQPIYQGNRWLFPEKLQEDIKENASLMGSSALPKVLAWTFFYRNDDTGKWNKRIVLDYPSIQPTELRDSFQRQQPEFLYEKDDYADDWENLVHWFIGNCSNVAPFRYYSQRSIGYLLYGVCLIQNRLRCRFTDATFESLLWYFRNVTEDDREKIEKVDLHHLGIIPDGLSFVGRADRNQVDPALVLLSLNQGRQLMAESASSFLPNVAVEGDKPPMTATESLIRENASVNLTSAVLNQTYNDSESLYRETCRRFCIKNNPDPIAKAFREEMRKEEVPDSVIDCEAWDIVPDRVMGGGNRAVELTTSRALFEIAPQLDPEAQRIVKRKYVLALTDDPVESELIVPEAGPVTSDATVLATLAFGTLMLGVPVVSPRNLNEIDYVEALIKLMGMQMESVPPLLSAPESLPNAAEKLTGLTNVGAHIEAHISLMAQDKTQKERVKLYHETLQELMNQLRVFAQQYEKLEQDHAESQQQGQGGVSPEAQAKIIEAGILGEAKAKIAEFNAQQKQQHKDLNQAAESDRRDAAAQAEINRKMALTAAEIAAKDLQTEAEIRRPKPAPAAAK